MLYFPLLYLYQILSKIIMSTTLQIILTFLILGKRLHDFVVGVLDEKRDHFNLCGTYVGDAPRGKWTQISCIPNANGRNVLITIPSLSSDGSFLTLCEVEVFGNSKWSTYCTIMSTFTIMTRCMLFPGGCLLMHYGDIQPRLHLSYTHLPYHFCSELSQRSPI